MWGIAGRALYCALLCVFVCGRVHINRHPPLLCCSCLVLLPQAQCVRKNGRRGTFWKKLYPIAVSVSEKRDVIITYSRERLNVRIGSTLSQSLLKRSCLSDSQTAPGLSCFYCQYRLCEDVFSVCVLRLSSLVSDTHQLDFLSLFVYPLC